MPKLGNSRRRHPHQVFLAGLCTLTGLPVVVGGAQPDSLTSAMPHTLVWLWAASLTAGGAIVVAAAAVRRLLTALYLELVADLPVALSCASYAAALVTLYGAGHLGPVITFGGAGVSFLIRFVQVLRAFRRLHHELARRTGAA